MEEITELYKLKFEDQSPRTIKLLDFKSESFRKKEYMDSLFLLSLERWSSML